MIKTKDEYLTALRTLIGDKQDDDVLEILEYANKIDGDKESEITTLKERITTLENEKTEIDKVLFKIKLKEEAPIFNSFDDIKEKIFQNDRYKKRFSFDINNIFIKDDAIEAQYLNKKRFRDYKDEDYINGFLENENNHYEIDNKRKRGRVPKV
mgnify:CR=1 FL=1